ncbi:MAG TPA: PEP/pyruvate-binding domain-containing protein [Gaiellaceae bacterium]|nr:PEP/pyruvate-binding domain-containing protein [Gaiellaceae bacterium]
MYVVPFRALGLDDIPLAGGKSAHLGDLTQAGFPVPPGFAVTTRAFDAVVAEHVLELVDGLDPEDVAALEARAAQVRDLVESLPVPEEVADAIRHGYALLAEEIGVDRPAVAVRSSAVAEDAADASFAGMQSTYLWLRGADDALAGVRRCWASYFNAEALAYRAQHGGAAGMSVAVQYMVDARVAGVMFTLNPVSGDPSTIAIDASYGLGVTVVGGEVTPDSFLWSKVTRELVRSQVGAKEVECVADPDAGGVLTRPVPDELRSRPCLEPAEVEHLAELGRAVERHYGRPQDLEWAIDRDRDEIFLLQARPETVWAAKRAVAGAGSTAERVAALYLKGGWIKS